MRKNGKLSYANTMYYCPGCNANDMLFEETEEEIKEFLFWTIKKELLVHRIFCERCRFDIPRDELLTIKQKVTEAKGVVRTEEKISVTDGTKLITNTKVTTSYAGYIPDVTDKILYFDMLYLLIDFIDTYEEGLDLGNDTFYQQAAVVTSINDDDLQGNVEELIREKYKLCIDTFTRSDLNSILRNSLLCVKGRMLLSPRIINLYNSLFGLMGIGELRYQSFFISLR